MPESSRITVPISSKDIKNRTRLASGGVSRLTVVPMESRRLRLMGLYFDTEKSFLLPSAMAGIRKIREVYDKKAFPELLCVGHTDAAGKSSYNLKLSLERAQSIAAYLADDVETWLKNYSHTDSDKRWGRREDELMLSALPISGGTKYFSDGIGFKDAVMKFQADAGLTEDGICGPMTRRALITDYMKFDGTSLPKSVTIIAHGCGEYFPVEDVGDGVASEKNRRVDLFAFNGKIYPEPTSPTSSSTDPFYKQWVAQVSESIDLTEELPDNLRIRLCDDRGEPMPKTVFLARFGHEPAHAGQSDSSGYANLAPPKVCPEMLKLAWGADNTEGEYRFVRELFVDCDGGSSDQQYLTRLHNLGYPSTEDMELAVRAFQSDFKVDCEPTPRGQVNGEIPPATRERIAQEFKKRKSA
ncbi:MAG: OmpA family protein [Candidatus Zixiibacteriota bacterium]